MSITGASGPLQLDQVVHKILDYRSDRRISAESLLTFIRTSGPDILVKKIPEYDELSPLWFLAVTAAENETTDSEKRSLAIEKVLERWIFMFSLSDFLVAPNDEQRKNRSALWFLAAATCKAFAPSGFNLFWKRWKEDLSLYAFTLPDMDGISPLWWLFKAAKLKNETINEIWQKWGKSLTPTLLRKKPTGEYAGQSLQWLVIDAAQTHPDFRFLVEQMLRFLPEILSDDDIVERPQNEKSIVEKLQCAGDWGKKVQSWINARNNFFIELNASKTNRERSFSISWELMELAEKAFHAGYIEAFYDLQGLYAERSENFSGTSFDDLSDDDFNYPYSHVRSCVCASKNWLRIGMNQTLSKHERTMCLKKALAYALNVPLTTRGSQFPSRASLFRDIVCCYINEGKSLRLERNLPPSLLKKMEKMSSVSTLYQLCAQAEEIYKFGDCSMTLQGRIVELESSLHKLQLKTDNSQSSFEYVRDSSAFIPSFTVNEALIAAVEPSSLHKFDLKNEREHQKPQPHLDTGHQIIKKKPY